MGTRWMILIGVVGVLATTGIVLAASQTSGTYQAALSGDPIGVKTTARGEASFQLSPDGKRLHYRLIVDDIHNPLVAHLHHASDHEILVRLFPVQSSTSEPDEASLLPIQGRYDGMLAEGTLTSADLRGFLAGKSISDLIAQIEAGRVYVNVHTSDMTAPSNTSPGDYPSGEIGGFIQ